ncbi:MAG TPA: diguanylate cyclase [Sulfuriferula sp.]|nr:diguanylate cyclase [Sulfuriferula sp.]
MQATKNLTKKKLLGLRIKLMLVVVIGLLVGVSILGYFKLQQDRLSIYQAANGSGQERIALIAKSISNLLAGYDYTNMESLAGSIVAAPDVQILRIINRKGKIVVERTKKNPGQDGKSLSFTAPVIFGTETIGRVEMLVSTNKLEEALRDSFRVLVLRIGLVILFLGVLIYIAASLVILTPIAKIRNKMQEIVANPDGEIQTIKVSGNDELADLASIFNKMQTSLYMHQQQLKARVQIADEKLIKANQELTLRSEELEKMVALAQRLATTDSLTGLQNRRFLDENLGSVLAQAKRHADSLCLVLLDVDHFKKINDEHGHAAGDVVLKLLGDLIRWRTRDSDISARMGGDEFAFILPRTSVAQGKVFAESLLEKTRAHAFVVPGEKILKVTLSVGVAGLSEDIQSVEALYGAADKALYESKHRGRNQVTGIYKNEFV